jgi:hypothetical protein
MQRRGSKETISGAAEYESLPMPRHLPTMHKCGYNGPGRYREFMYLGQDFEDCNFLRLQLVLMPFVVSSCLLSNLCVFVSLPAIIIAHPANRIPCTVAICMNETHLGVLCLETQKHLPIKKIILPSVTIKGNFERRNSPVLRFMFHSYRRLYSPVPLLTNHSNHRSFHSV